MRPRHVKDMIHSRELSAQSSMVFDHRKTDIKYKNVNWVTEWDSKWNQCVYRNKLCVVAILLTISVCVLCIRMMYEYVGRFPFTGKMYPIFHCKNQIAFEIWINWNANATQLQLFFYVDSDWWAINTSVGYSWILFSILFIFIHKKGK